MTDQDPTQAYQPPEPPPAPDVNTPPGVEPPPAAPFAAIEPNLAQVVPTEPVAITPPAPRPGRSKLKWLVAAVAVLLVAGTAAGATLLLTGDSADPAVLSYAPADSIVYVEARLDLPGDQGAELAKVMKAFPGFEDQAAFPVKLSEMLDQLVGKASDGKMGWKADIEPWFGGQVAATIGKLPTADEPSAVHAVVIVSLKDAAKATAWADRFLAERGATSTTEAYGGTTITVITPPSGLEGAIKGAYAVTGAVLALGDLDSVKAVIDTKGTAGLPTNAQFKEANAAATGDRLGFAYVDYKALMAGLTDLMPAEASAQLPASLLDKMPAWAIETFRAKDSAFVVDVKMPHSELSGAASESRLPAHVPASTLVLLDGHDLGASLKQVKDLYGGMEPYKDAVKQLDDALALLGGFDDVTGWMGESAVAISRSGDSITGGILIVPNDRADADRLFTQLKGFLVIGGAQAGIAVSDEDYKGTKITVIDLSGIAAMAGGMAPGVEIPSDLKVSYAITDEVVVLGYGTDFVKAVLDAPGGESLATTPRFKDALGRVGASGSGLTWIDIAGIRDVAETFLPGDVESRYESDVKPYLDAFDYLIVNGAPGSPHDTGSVVLHVSGD